MGICESTKKDENSGVRNNLKKNHQVDSNSLETNQDIKQNINDTLVQISPITQKQLPLKIYADIHEVQYPIYVQKNQELSFTGVSGEWSFLPEYGMTNYEGHSQSKYNNINVGALLFKVLGGETFYISNKLTYVADSTGPLVFSANCDKSEANFYSPKGVIEVELKGGMPMTQEKIDQLCGWKITQINSTDISNKEREVIYYINKIRTSPQLFSKLYMSYFISSDNNNSKHKETICSKLTPLPELTFNISLSKAAKDHANDIGENGTTGHISSNNKTIKERIEEYEKRVEYFGENCCYSLGNSLAIVINMIVDNNLTDKFNQNNILNPSFTDIGICLRKHQSFKWCCVILFGKLSSINDSK